MSYSIQDYQESASYIEQKLNGFVPEILLILGSGLGFMGDMVENPLFVEYSGIPNFKSSTAPGHKGRFVFGMLGGKKVAVMQGRMHCYEGYSMEDVSFPVRVLKLLGAEKLIVTNAAGCLRSEWNVGDLMLITDHIRIFGFGPLQGPNVDTFGTRFPDMSSVYSKKLRFIALETAKEQKLPLREGVYMFFPGPQFETPAEVRAAGILGADACGMSTVPEATTAVHAGMEVLGITLCSNYAAGISGKPLSGEEVNQAASDSSPRFSALILGILKKM